MKRRIRSCPGLPPREGAHEKGQRGGRVGTRRWNQKKNSEREKEREREGEDIIAGGLMRRHNCTIIDDRFIRRPWTASLCSTHRRHRTAMAAYYYKGKTVLHGVGMPGWSEMTITEGILAKCAPPLYPLFRGTQSSAVVGMRCRSSVNNVLSCKILRRESFERGEACKLYSIAC